ncbi:MAG TPA: hypothetical protein VGJ87_26060, partial [Roseiflexaceae bacterium]
MSDPRFAPDFDVVIDGQPVPAPLRASISSVSLQTGLEGADRVELSVVNEGLRWLDSPLLALDRQLALRIGYTSGQLEQVFDGEIVSQTPTFSGSPTIAVAAQDRRRRLQRGSKARWFTIPALGTHIPIPDLLIADLVSLENLLVPNVDAAGVVQSLGLYLVNVIIGVIGGAESMQRLIRRQNDESDMDFL